jgi:predicted Fe-Mo cluster-binding NifX family protein
MKIAVSASGPSIDAELDPRFGRCAYFVLFDTTSQEAVTAANPHAAATGGAGVQAARLVTELGAERVLTGSCGPNARQALNAAGIAVVEDCSGTVRSALADLETGRLPTGEKGGSPAGADPPRQSGASRGRGGGRGLGRGGGGGGGRGLGRGGGGGGGRGRGRGQGGR